MNDQNHTMGQSSSEYYQPSAKTEFITKDSGERKTFKSGMQRDTAVGKLLWHLVFFGPMLRRWVSLLTRGAIKYDVNNWMKADGQEELDRFKASAARHFAQWFNGDEPEEDHAAAIFFNVNGVEYVKGKLGTPAQTEAERVSEAVSFLQKRHTLEINRWRHDVKSGHRYELWGKLIERQARELFHLLDKLEEENNVKKPLDLGDVVSSQNWQGCKA